jgi:hypothetical protein
VDHGRVHLRGLGHLTGGDGVITALGEKPAGPCQELLADGLIASGGRAAELFAGGCIHDII